MFETERFSHDQSTGRAVRPSKENLEQDFVCPKCHARGALVHEIVLRRTAVRILPVAPAHYLAASCCLCGYTELYHRAIVLKAEQRSRSDSKTRRDADDNLCPDT